MPFKIEVLPGQPDRPDAIHASECSVYGRGAPTDMGFKLAAFSLVFVTFLAAAGCEQADPEAAKRIQPVYDQQTGKLKLLKYDANNDGKVDTWSYMDGARIVRIEIDKDGDDTIDRWNTTAPIRSWKKSACPDRTTARKTPGRTPDRTAPWPASRYRPAATAT